jgi:DNA polymerase-3 subunit gamma/tau
MVSQVFYRKWRPQLLAEVAGQEQVTRTLLNALASERISHAYLFCGPRGTGKTSTGRILSKAVNCLTNKGKGEPCNTCQICQAITEGRAMDVIEVDAASNRGIDEIRDLREKVNYASGQARYKVYIIDEVHMLTKEASNALLKTLEEPPPHVIFILATTEIHKVLPTILSRCQRFDFHRIAQEDVINKLAQICETECINIEPEALKLISRAATGSLRDAENILQQMATYYGSDITLQQVKSNLGISGDSRARELIKNIINNDAASGIATINGANADGIDLRQFNREVVEYLRDLLLIKSGSEAAIDLVAEDISELKELAGKTSITKILKAVKLFGQMELNLDNYSTLPLELALIECALPEKEGEAAPHPAEPKAKKPAPATDAPPVIQEPPPEAVKEGKPSTPKAETPKKTKPEETAPATAANREMAAPADKEAIISPLGAGSDIENIRLNWKRLISEAPANISRSRAAALLRSATPKDITDEEIVLSFKYPLHKENMEKLENQKTAEKIVSGFLGRTYRIQCIYEAENHLVKAALRMGAQIISTEEE